MSIKKIAVFIFCVIIILNFTPLITAQVFKKALLAKLAYASSEITATSLDPSGYIIIKSKSPEQYFEDAKSFIESGKYKKALSIYNYLLDITKDRPLKGKVIAQKRAVKKLIAKEEKKLEEERKEKIKELRSAGLSAYQKDDIDTAEKKFKELLELNPNDSATETYLEKYIPKKKKELAQEKQRTAQRAAREQEKAAQRANQKKIDSLYSRGKSYYGNGDLDNAKKTFNEILKIDPKNSTTKTYLEKYIPKKKQELAQKKQRAAEQAAREQKRAAEQAAREQKRAAEQVAREQEKAAQRANQKKIDSLYSRGKTYYRNDDLDNAKKTFNEILQVDPKNTNAKTYLEKYIPKKKKELAQEKQRAAQRAAREQKKAAQQAAREQEKTAQQVARKQEKAAQRVNQKEIDSLYSRAIYYYKNGYLENAKKTFNEILKIDPKNTDAKTYLEKYIPKKKQELAQEKYNK